VFKPAKSPWTRNSVQYSQHTSPVTDPSKVTLYARTGYFQPVSGSTAVPHAWIFFGSAGRSCDGTLVPGEPTADAAPRPLEAPPHI